MITELTNKQKVELNNIFQSKLAWKQRQAIERSEKINDFIKYSFDYELPKDKKYFYQILHRGSPEALTVHDVFPELIREYYKLSFNGLSIGSYFEDKSGQIETQVNAHIYSKHRTDPIWNWRKSQLIRKKYRAFLRDNFHIVDKYHPLHLVLTVPHADGKFENKEVYVGALIRYFWEMRRSKFWRERVWGGEYGVEVKESKSGQGLHIHIHSLVFLKNKNVNKFREELQKKWQSLTGGISVWAETLYFYKRKANRQFITETKHRDKICEQADNNKIIAYFLDKVVVRKKFYIDKERQQIEKDTTLTPEGKKDDILDLYTDGVLECIKYHFKDEDIFTDFELYEQVLQDTKGLKLYSRFGKLYNNKSLSFNSKKDEDADENIMGEATRTTINPFNHTEVNERESQIITYYPSQQRRQSANAAEPYKLINNRDKSIYNFYDKDATIKDVFKNFFNKNIERPTTEEEKKEKTLFFKKFKEENGITETPIKPRKRKTGGADVRRYTNPPKMEKEWKEQIRIEKEKTIIEFFENLKINKTECSGTA